ncbi:methyl-accepting chemotaxis protein [Jannaschia sp. LMIT008]|uniref:methyl-accepting chemotaxis protein n=1 Tax=Jannaschia maritima TaxID=3032585 RepID=UPI0028115BA1|nr:methyl-accepting chemotaxis protein [Jannaschia sp. LMIT008]
MTTSPPSRTARRLPDCRGSMMRVGRCRGFVLTAGMMAVLVVTAETEEVRAEAEAEFRTAIRNLHATLADSADCMAALPRTVAADIAAVRDFADVLLPFDARDDLCLDSRIATRLARQARWTALPALYNIVGAFDVMLTEEREEAIVALRDRSVRMEGMFEEMQKIGRTIRLVSLNAAVEAARTGGASGAAFGVIATEVRNLATQASTLLARTRADIASDRAP